jgi:hypothetical protein
MLELGEHGAEALSDRCRRPVRYANQLPPQIESLIVALKREKPHWGARKIRELLMRSDNPFGTRLSPMSWVRPVTHVSGPCPPMPASMKSDLPNQFSKRQPPTPLHALFPKFGCG